jgi:kynurenine formamidase|tara:strand:- start:10347 stop:11081 length:735 start_codon:yes stop_codon:yes gene_type:complete
MKTPDLVYDISTVIEEGRSRAWYIPGMQRDPVKLDGWIGSVNLGGDVNFFNLNINPHAHGSHTETLGHVCKSWHPISEIRIPFIQSALLITVNYEDQGKDGKIINLDEVENAWKKWKPSAGLTALVVRTNPNSNEKKITNFSSKDAPFFSDKVGEFLRERGILHWLVDLPSVDREEDGGALLTHRSFWGLDPMEKRVSEKSRPDATISELIFIDDCIEDGYWTLAMQVAAIANDAAPSRPLLMR